MERIVKAFGVSKKWFTLMYMQRRKVRLGEAKGSHSR